MKFNVSIIAFLILITSILLFSLTKNFDSNLTNPSPTPIVNPSPVLKTMPKQIKMIEVVFNDQRLIIYTSEIPKAASLALIANFSDKQTGQRLVDKYNCDLVINGGFYQENGQPLGLFVTEGSKSGEQIKSNLVNGFFWQDKDGGRFIGKNPPSLDNVSFIFQSGPYIQVGEYKLRLVSDEPTRRSLLGIDENDKLYVIAVVDKENNLSGPFLSDIPEIFNDPMVQEKLQITTLLNLDGGSASFFYAKDETSSFSLSEITPIGSLLCIVF